MLIEIEYRDGSEGLLSTENIKSVYREEGKYREYYSVGYTDIKESLLISERGYKTLCEAIKQEKEERKQQQQDQSQDQEKQLLLQIAADIRQQLTEINNELKRINGYADRRD